MREIEALIFRQFFAMGFSARSFNALPESEKAKVFNTICFEVKKKLVSAPGMEADRIRRVFKRIDSEVFGVLYG